MNRMRSRTLRVRRLAAVLAIAPVLLMSGCLAVAAGAVGAGTVAYIRGEIDASLNHNIDAVDRAANRAAGQLRFAKINESSDALAHVITLRTAEDKKIEVRLTRTGEAMTRVRIRVGLIGDEAISRALLERIQANL